MNDPRLGRAVSYEPSVEQRDEEGIEGAGFGTSENEVVLLESSDAEDVVAASAEEEEEEEEEERGRRKRRLRDLFFLVRIRCTRRRAI